MIAIYLFLFIFGTVMGSFYTVVGTRLPRNESIIKPGSHCEYCQKQLKWYELIPVLSYLFQKGKCRTCQNKLSLLYPLIEILTGTLFCLSFFKFGLTANFLISLCLSSLLTIIFVSDIKYMIILDSPLLISGLLIFLCKWITLGFKPALLALGNGLISFLILLAIGKVGDILFKRESMGGGDIKLSFLFGLTLGYQMAIVALIFSTFLALPYAVASLFLTKVHEVPFGPFLISSLWLVFFFYEKFQTIIMFLFQI